MMPAEDETMGKTFKILLIVAALALFLPALIYGIYLGTGRSAWLAWKAQREAMGDRFEWEAMVPPSVPDEDNFALAPIVAGAIKGKDLDPRFQALKLPPIPTKAAGDWREGKRADLDAFANALGNSDILQSLRLQEPALAELDQASRRKGSHIPVDYAAWEGEGLLGFRDATRTLRLRALARLSRGNSAGALGDVETCFRITGHLQAEPSLLAVLLRMGIVNISMQTVWEGLLDHRWNPSQLQRLQDCLEHVDLISHFRLAMESERLHMVDSLLSLAEERPRAMAWNARDEKFFQKVRNSRRILPFLWKGWVYRNVLELSRYETVEAIDVFPRGRQRVTPNPGTVQDRWKKFDRRHKDLIMARIAVPALLDQPQRVSYLQASLNHAALACALERFLIDHRAFPDRLEDLVPSYLKTVPHDLITGAPLSYQRNPDGTFRLYSTGWDGTDQSGDLAWTRDSPPVLDLGRGDWPWFATAQSTR